MSTSSSPNEEKKVEVVMDRVVSEVVAPPMFRLELDQLKDERGLPRLDVLKDHLLREGRLTPEAATFLISGASAVYQEEPNMLKLDFPLTVCGDIHGQFFDLVRLFEVGGDPAATQFLFLGDYVDRGCFSTECVFYLFAHKMVYPSSFFLLRGNHECRQLTAFFNFKDECAYKYSSDIYDAIMNAFDYLPLSAIINNQFFCVHGGLSPDITTLEEIGQLNRVQEIPREGPMCDLLWSDPFEEDGEPKDESDEDEETGDSSWFGYNDTRQCSYVYGVEAVKQFLQENKLTSIIRAHEAQIQGYKMQMLNRASGIPRVITIFSAPNYCDIYNNKAACLKFDNNVLNIKQFIDSPHPYYLPKFMDVFQWSLPFVAEKVCDMLAAVLAGEDDESSSDEEILPVQTKEPSPEKKGMLKQKVVAVSKIMRMYRILREENEAIVQLKELSPGNKMPLGLLQGGSAAIQEAVAKFENAKQADLIHEAYPLNPRGHRPTASDSRMYEIQRILSPKRSFKSSRASM